MIILKNVVKSYKMGEEVIYALNNVNLRIEEGEFVSIMGPSGSGKSTLLNIIGCLDRPDNGEVYIDSVKASDLNDNQLTEIRRMKIGFVFQQFNLIPLLSALENVELPLIFKYRSNMSSEEKRKRALECLKMAELDEKFANHKPNQLSGGQQQRVAIARALANDPPILLCDEPTGSLDSKTGAKIMELLKKLNKSGKTVVMVTHDINVGKVADRIINIRDGELVEE
ncbi:ABC transporter ATP-binding protein [Methanothermococcus okinawensis]|uniref:Phosphonate-transporting ATPase n=1 Tax=Methanothermococcus okinawensis (strain DSM 14208 / JCM 11175 / IH1) TaxID=647113 RepID=F8AL00_METOI|nr:ABC transporter ATP-binding protein [Methanothermococcus okinawensis]AEH06435.1 Phosphonate-transporting ATPase [Methanothermococcus okinawensis IH1]AEH06702.1 Phosphonate-transporting ATPase [Methanothermococcus okinawensis IH1]